MSRPIGGLSKIAPGYDHILCDVWGVIHNGRRSWSETSEALTRFRDQGGTVILITNAPRPAGPVQEQLDGLDVPRSAYDDIVTSGDVTRTLLAEAEAPVFHLGPERDHTLYRGLDVHLSGEGEAQTVSCTGLFDDTTETPSDYDDILRRFRSRDLPLICANPDLVVERGDTLVWCAGAIARDYAAMGGKVLISGKPHPPIYAEAISRIETITGKPANPRRVLAIGDGMPTDVKGANNAGIDLLYISQGIHSSEYADMGDGDSGIEEFLQVHKAKAVAHIPRLKW
ncbi:MAG: TIGR01459 family HAD-type hydrolase [Pseudomonadota bacterium]